mmetsp:Transcript_29209/g.73742  ORF Transcript_29209/g.73742 Transcript_29209/m.73742 type:complete len:235 (-) Transcript_29209:1759-2463(-)
MWDIGQWDCSGRLCHIEAADVVQMTLSLTQDLGGQARDQHLAAVVQEYVLCCVVLPNSEDIVLDWAAHVDVSLQKTRVLGLLVKVEGDKRFRETSADEAAGTILPAPIARVHVRLEVLLEVRRCRLLAIQARSRLAQPPVQPDKHKEGLPKTAEEVCPPLLAYVLGPPSGNGDHLCNAAHFPARKLHSDSFDDLLRGHRPNITHILEHPQLTRLEEQPPRPNGPLALVDLKGQH